MTPGVAAGIAASAVVAMIATFVVIGRQNSSIKKRLDIILVERGFAESRAQAQALVIAGLVRATTSRATRSTRPSSSRSTVPPRYVSRGGEKLTHGLDGLGVDPAGLDCVDVGASTGGFTDVLLERGAARVIAIDVGYGQLHPRLRSTRASPSSSGRTRGS